MLKVVKRLKTVEGKNGRG